MSASFVSFECLWPQWTQNNVQKMELQSNDLLCSLTETSSISTAISGKTAAISCARSTTAGPAMSKVAPSTAGSQSSGPGPSALPASRNRHSIAPQTRTHPYLKCPSWSNCSEPLTRTFAGSLARGPFWRRPSLAAPPAVWSWWGNGPATLPHSASSLKLTAGSNSSVKMVLMFCYVFIWKGSQAKAAFKTKPVLMTSITYFIFGFILKALKELWLTRFKHNTTA